MILIMPYFGTWPEWFELFLETCRWNASIHWEFFTDCEIPDSPPENVRFTKITFAEYCDRVSHALGIRFAPQHPYKLCDIRPMLGHVHQLEIARYDYFGYGDIDVFYGDIRRIYNEDLLNRGYACISSSAEMVSGHFALFRTCQKTIEAYKKIPGWQTLAAQPSHQCVDENHQSRIYLPSSLSFPLNKISHWAQPLKGASYFREQYTTPFIDKPWIDGSFLHPDLWTWKEGRLTNNRDRGREFLYLHFMNFRSARYLPTYRGSQACWASLERVNWVTKEQMGEGWTVGPDGIRPFQELQAAQPG